jgi:hypothetical protein
MTALTSKTTAPRRLNLWSGAIEEHGECPPDGSPGFPDGVATVTREQWRAAFYSDARAKEDKVTEDTLRKRFNRAVLDLTTAKQLESVGEWFWLA